MFGIDVLEFFRAVRSEPRPWYFCLSLAYAFGVWCGLKLSPFGIRFLKYREDKHQRDEQRRIQEAENSKIADAAAAEKHKQKAYEALRAHYDLAPDVNTLVAKDKADSRRYCLRCAKSKNLVALDSHGDNRWFCPACGWRSWPKKYGPNGVE